MQPWEFYTARQLKPHGWMRRQLQIQAEGLSGNLDKVWRDVRDSAWIGGDAEGWERVPYWLDGFIPLAYLLEDEDLIARAKKYVTAILDQQREDGWICPCTEEQIPTYDTWAVLLISKVLTVYYECSGDERIPSVLYRTMKNYHRLLKEGKICLFSWGKYRWYEGFIALNFLKERYDEAWIGELAAMLREQGTRYTELMPLWKSPRNRWTFDTHIVNLGMMLKYEAVSHALLGEEYTDVAEQLYTVLKEYNGTPVDLFTGDECLSGRSPIQGTELCAVVEQMYSYEHLFAATGDAKWAERLELLAFNALPATLSDDMWAHQYVQMSNQIACRRFPGQPIFRTNNYEAHLFGLEPNYGCCTANFNQGWPKLALASFMHRENTVISAVPIPSVLTTKGCSIELDTDYPFVNRLTYKTKAKEATTLKVRIPSFARNLRVNGNAVLRCDFLSFDLPADSEQVIEITFDTLPEMITRPHGLKSVRCGSLVFSLPISYEAVRLEYERGGVERHFPYCDYEYLPTSDFAFAFASPLFEVERRPLGEIPFDSKNPAIRLRARMCPIAWGMADGYDSVCAIAPAATVATGEEREMELYPYGCAKLRMTEMPLI